MKLKILFLIVSLVFIAGIANGAWFSDYSYRKKITLTGQTGAGTNYQVDLSIGNSSGGDFHLEGNCGDFPNDIRFTDDDETTELDYWIEDTSVDPITVWVEVADDLGSNTDIYVYYGKSSVSDASDGDDTFLFFDDFPGSSIDTNKWTVIQGNVGVSGSNLVLTGGEATRGLIDGKTNCSYPLKIMTKCYGTADARYRIFHFCSLRKQNDWGNRVDPYGGSSETYMNFTTGKDGTYTSNPDNVVSALTNTHIYKTIWEYGKGTFFQDGNSIAQNTTNIPIVDLVPVFYEGTDSGPIMYFDWVLLAKYHDPEPAFNSAGSQETGGSGSLRRIIMIR